MTWWPICALPATTRAWTHAVELNRIFADWCAARPLQAVLQAFDAAGGTIAPVYDIEQIEADPQLRARGAICDVPDADFGTVRMAGVVPRFAQDPCAIRASGGALGQDNERYFREELGLPIAEWQRLRAEHIV